MIFLPFGSAGGMPAVPDLTDKNAQLWKQFRPRGDEPARPAGLAGVCDAGLMQRLCILVGEKDGFVQAELSQAGGGNRLQGVGHAPAAAVELD
ncbi:hypothetical protein BA011_28735 (plasmid) [Rhizobium leguminosarum]|uniref:Uncharacterized protein n=1 Tax=Rhizobium leguminosarum TaxID=384 RepID=A0A1B1CIX9_RHILE|nr:hypothetical protein BA011_28735 [Rhizobium leguminosarum]